MAVRSVPMPVRTSVGGARRRGAIALAAVAIAGCGASDPGPAPAVPVASGASADPGPGFVDPGSERAVIERLASARSAKASPTADPGAVTRSGLYATAAQAARALASRPGAALQVRVDTGGWDAAELAANCLWGELIASDLPRDTPVFVRGDDARLAATVVDRLAADGLTRVFLVASDR